MGRLRDFVWRSPFFPRKLSFTREGKVVVLVSIGLGVAAVNTGNNLIYLVFSLSLSLILLSGILSEANLRRIGCQPLRFMRVPARESVPIVVTIASRRRRFAAWSVEAWPWFDSGEVAVEPARFLQVGPKVTLSGTCRVTFARRGDYSLRGMVLSTGFPFSFFRKSVVFPVGEGGAKSPLDGVVIRVHPRVHDLRAHLAALAPLGEEEDRPVPGRGIEFFGVRDYRPGDHPRLILYRRSASRSTPVVREVEDQGMRAVWVVLLNAVERGSTGHGVDPEGVEAAIEAAASLAVSLVRTGHRVGLWSATTVVSPGSGEAQVERILDALATIPVLVVNRDEMAEVQTRVTPPADGARVVWVTPESVNWLTGWQDRRESRAP